MGIDIETFCQVYKEGKWIFNDKPIFNNNTDTSPFEYRNKDLYQLLIGFADKELPSILKKCNGLPDGFLNEFELFYGKYNDDNCYDYNQSHIYLKDLLNFDYSQDTIDYYSKEKTTVKEAVGETFFEDLEQLKQLGVPENVRIVFWFS